MRLSELKTGEKGVIVKVLGHGGFRKRIVEMGFIKGKTVEVILNAPLKDPIKYKILGYEISLRRQEAEMIEVVDETQVDKLTRASDIEHSSTHPLFNSSTPPSSTRQHVNLSTEEAMQELMSIEDAE